MDPLEIPKSHFVRLIDSMMQAAACPSSNLPGQEPIKGWAYPDGESCRHWQEMVGVMNVTDAAIDRACTQQKLGDALGSDNAEAVLIANRSDIAQFVDDFCGTPPKWPLQWPRPNVVLRDDGLRAADLIVAALRFHAAAEGMEGSLLHSEFATAADRLFEVGLSRLV